jgi:hypothetical protein
MTTKDGILDIEYKVGITDSAGAVLDQNGKYIDLTDCTVVFDMKDNAGHSHIIPCDIDGWYHDVFYPRNVGGCTINFTSLHTAVIGQFQGEFVISRNGLESRVPSGNEYYYVMIYPKI